MGELPRDPAARVVRAPRAGRGVRSAAPDEAKPGNHPLLLLHAGVPLGVIRVDIDGDRAIFRRVAIREDAQRRGHGRAMLEAAEAFARGQDCVRVESHVDADAVPFYLRCGFHPVEPAPAGGGRTVFMAKRLEA